MEKKDFVSLEVATLLKAKGYKEPSHGEYCKRFIDKERQLIIYTEICEYDEYSGNIIAPSLYDAQKWLIRKGLYVNPCICRTGWSWEIIKCKKVPKSELFEYYTLLRPWKNMLGFNSYKEVLLDGIETALEILK